MRGLLPRTFSRCAIASSLTVAACITGCSPTEESKRALPASAYGGVISEGGGAWLIGGWEQTGMRSCIARIRSGGREIEMMSPKASWAERSYFGIVKLEDRFVLAGGFNYESPSRTLCDVWATRDKAHWDLVSVDPAWEQREAHGLVAHRDAVYLLGGVTYFRPEQFAGKRSGPMRHLRPFSDVWKSADGFSWELATAHADWGPRRSFGCLSLDGYIWVFGGINDATATLYNDVWRSSDGVDWELVTNEARWSRRIITSSIATFCGRLWMIGGGGSATELVPLNDIWTSIDGRHWEKLMDSAPFPARCGAFVFSMKWNGTDYLFVYGGVSDAFPGGRRFFRDLSRSPDGRNW